jgi:putative tricarboxylic transport membrane protein
MIKSGGDPLVFVQRPISAGLLVMAVAVLAVILLPQVARKRDEVFPEEEA